RGRKLRQLAPDLLDESASIVDEAVGRDQAAIKHAGPFRDSRPVMVWPENDDEPAVVVEKDGNVLEIPTVDLGKLDGRGPLVAAEDLDPLAVAGPAFRTAGFRALVVCCRRRDPWLGARRHGN